MASEGISADIEVDLLAYPLAQEITPNSREIEPPQLEQSMVVIPVTVATFDHVTVDQSDFSKFWENQHAFEPKSFSEKVQTPRKCNDILFLVFFLFNIIVLGSCSTVMIPTRTNSSMPSKNPTNITNETSVFIEDAFQMSSQKLVKLVSISTGASASLSLAFNVAHFFFIKYGTDKCLAWNAIIGISILIVFSIYPIIKSRNYLLICVPVLSSVCSLFFNYIAKRYFHFTGEMIKQAISVLRNYPSLFFVVIGNILLNFIVTVIAIIMTIYCFASSSLIFLIWIFLSYFWIIHTNNYITYMTTAGVYSTWFFVPEHEAIPSDIVFFYFKRAVFYCFGSASFSGFVIPSIQLLNSFLNSIEGKQHNFIVQFFECATKCFLSFLEFFVKHISRYALVYCGTFGVPFYEGCRRWDENTKKKSITPFILGNVLTENFFVYGISLTVTSTLISYLISCFLTTNHMFRFLSALIAACFFYSAFNSMTKLVHSGVDTLIVCFTESPKKMKDHCQSLYDEFCLQFTHGNGREQANELQDANETYETSVSL